LGAGADPRPMTTRHREIEEEFFGLLEAAGLPEPDDVARLSRALIFLWYDTKAFVLVDLDELPLGADPLDGLDVEALRLDIEGMDPFPGSGAPFPPGFLDAA
jgi:hypothetical protein